MAVRVPTVDERPEFAAQCAALRGKYPEIDAVIEDFREILLLDYGVPHVPVDADGLARVYAVKRDYPPSGSNGRGVFLLTYHATERKLSMSDPLCAYTLLTIDDLGQR